MYEAVANLLKKLLPPRAEEGRVLLLGLDASGKTTMLYRLKLGEVVTTIPTIGFNVEEVTWPTSNGGLLKVTAWDVGGCDKIKPLWRHYIQNTTGVIFVIDSNDRDRISEASEEMQYFRVETQSTPGLEGTPFLILANKQDRPNAMSVEEVTDRMGALSPDMGVFGVSAMGTAGEFKASMQPAFDWLASQMEARRNPPTEPAAQAEAPKETGPTPATSNPDPRSPEALAVKLNSWIERAENDCSPDELLEQFNTLTLPAWDQYTHVRVAYVILAKYGRQKGKNMIFDGIKHYIENSHHTNGKTFHLTMTYFWIQIVHFGIAGYHLPGSTIPSEPNPDQFAAFLLLNQHVVDTNLWEDYYSRSVIMTPQAKNEMVLPDKKNLPNIVQRDAPKLITIAKPPKRK